MRKFLRRRWLFLTFLAVGSVATAGMNEREKIFDTEKLKAIEEKIREAVEEGETPGAIVRIERDGAAFQVEVGKRAVEPFEAPMTADTVFDVASLTKVVSTAPAIVLLAEQNKVDLDAAVETYLPQFTGEGREKMTVRHLLTHTSGLRAGLSLNPPWTGREKAIELASGEQLLAEPGAGFVYSDINFILLGEIIARAGKMPLEEFVRENVHQPLGMNDTRYLPPESWRERIAPTQRTANGMLHGEVHDPTARAMGGVAGHAGIFSTMDDLARYARMLLNDGELDGVRFLSPGSVKEMTAVQTPEETGVRRGLGWDIDSRFSRPRGNFPLGSFGHTGWTGPCIWIDPFSETFWIFLSNRVHPDGSGNVIPLQRTLAGLVSDAVLGFDFDNVPGALEPMQERPAGR